MRLAHPAEQSVKNAKQINIFDRANHFGSDAETEEPLGSEDIVGRRLRISRYEQLAGNIVILKKPVTPFTRYSTPAIRAVFLVEFIRSLLCP